MTIVVLTALSACGKFGNKDDTRTLFDYAPESIGCLNDIGPQLQTFLGGSISEADWGKTCDCAIDSLMQFEQFWCTVVRPDGSYTQSDISGFLAQLPAHDLPEQHEACGVRLRSESRSGRRQFPNREPG